MVTKLARGLRQEHPPYGNYSALKVVPACVRGVHGLPSELRRSLQTNDYQLALRRLADVMAEFEAQIAAAQAGLTGPVASFDAVILTLEKWCIDETFRFMGHAVKWQGVNERGTGPAIFAYHQQATDLGTLLREARGYFEHIDPKSPRTLEMPGETAILMSRLEAAIRTPSAWVDVPDLDKMLDAAARHPRAALTEGIPIWLRERVRLAFLPIYLDVVRAREWARSRAAVLLATEAASVLQPASVQLTAVSKVYSPRPGDRTLAELVKAFKAANSEHPHRFTPVCAALEATLGSTKPVRAITRPDIKAVIAFVERIPPNAGKRWPKLTIAEAVVEADAQGLQSRLSKGSVSTYYDHMRTLFRWALDEEWIEETPCVNIRLESNPTVKPREFSSAELTRIFESLLPFRDVAPEKWWVPALALYQGSRQNELCQLAVADVEIVDDVTILNLSEFDERGVRSKAKSLKNDASERLIPVHPEIIAADFAAYVEERRAAGDAQLFPRLKLSRSGGHGHEFSKWWGRHLDRIGISDPRATFHSFRHGWREVAGLRMTDRQVDALGGWAPASQAAKYGRRTVVEELAPLIKRVVYRGFSLPG